MNRSRLAAAAAGVLVSAGASLAATTYFVATNGTDNDNCGTSPAPCRHIQFAIEKAVDGDTVRVRNGTYNECLLVSPSAGQLTVETDAFAQNGTANAVTLDGTGVCDTGPNAGPVVIIVDRSTIRGFKIQHGGDGGVWGFGAVAITNNTITLNSTPTFAGGLYAATGANILYADTKLQIKSNTIVSNTSVSDGGGAYVFAAGAGHPSVVEITDNIIRTNTAGPDPDLNNIFGTFGGGLTVLTGTDTSDDSSSVIITRNTIEGNTVNNPASGYGSYGGGVFLATGIYYGGYGTETISVGEVGDGNSVLTNTAGGYGGGISANVQPGLGGQHAIHVAGNSVSANTGGRGGGGIHGFVLAEDPDNNGTADLKIQDNAVTGNQALSLSNSDNLGGGGIFGELFCRKTPGDNITFEIERNTIQLNDASSLGGGASLFAYADDDPDGNGAIAPAGAKIVFRNNLVSQNEALDPGGPGTARGGGVWAAGRAFGDQAEATIDLDFLTVVGNHTDQGAGGIELEAYPEQDSNLTLGAVSIELTNSILANNDSFGAGGPIAPGGTVSVDIRYNDAFQNGGPTANWESNLGVTTGTNGNISVDPGLDSLFNPQLCSATIDAGDPAASVDDEPQPNGGIVNMGHLGGTSNATRTLPDATGDGVVDGIDVLRLAVAFGADALLIPLRYDAAVDFDADGKNDGTDLSYLASLYSRSCP
jgi:hypothetical protein